jgi:hypothetical protein
MSSFRSRSQSSLRPPRHSPGHSCCSIEPGYADASKEEVVDEPGEMRSTTARLEPSVFGARSRRAPTRSG